jgi:hypothetical protein
VKLSRKPRAKVVSAAASVIESLEERRLLSTTTVQSLPFLLDFSSDRGEIADKDGQGTGFTRVQANTAGTQYQPSLIDLDTTAGTLAITSQSDGGSNTGSMNNLDNALETQFDGSTIGFTITARIIGPLSYMNATFDQGGIYFGPDQDNFVKLIPEFGNSGNVLQFRDELGGSTTPTLPSSVQNVNIGSFASISTLDLRLTGTPSTGKISAYYAINGGGFVKLAADLTLTGANKTAFFNSTSRTGILAYTRNTGAPITVTFDSFGIQAGTPNSGQPTITNIRPANNLTAVSRDSFIAADVQMPGAGDTIDPTTLAGNVLVYRTENHTPIDGVVNVAAEGSTIVFTPSSILDANTSYTFEVTTGLKDSLGNKFIPFTSTFVTGTSGATVDPSVAFQQVPLSNATASNYTGVAVGPDGKLYASTIDGLIQRFTINADGALSSPQTIKTIQTNEGGPRAISGFAFDPSSTSNNVILWVSTSDANLTDAADWTGKIDKLTGANLSTYQNVITGLPRSVTSEMNNQPVFGPDGNLYFSEGSNTQEGAPDNAGDLRPEHLLNSAILELHMNQLGGSLPINVQTESVATPYNPFALNAPLTIYADGVADAYDLVFDDNGHLYAPSTGGKANGAAPASPNPAQSSSRIDETKNGDYNGPVVPGISQIATTEPDSLFDIQSLTYYGHPNPTRYEWVLDGGNPTSGADLNEVSQYPVGTQPDRNYGGIAFSFGPNESPAGAIEYHGSAFGGALDGKLLVTQSSGGDDIIALGTDGSGNVVSSTTDIAGFNGFVNPVDLTEDTNSGFIYVAEYGGQRITLLKPIATGSNITTDKSALYFNDIATGNSGGTGASPTQTITITNTGSAALTFPNNALTITGSDASTFSITNAASLTTLQPGDSFVLKINYTASIVGIQSATLTIQSNDPDDGTITISLRGLGTAGQGGTLEPSLQRILDLYQIPDNVGEPNPSQTAFPVPPSTPNDEVTMQRLMKAGDGDVSIQLLSVFDNLKSPATHVGYYDPGTPDNSTELFTVGINDAQSVDPTPIGPTSFDPGSKEFALYSIFPAFTNRASYEEDSLNTWDTTNHRKLRFYPLKNSDGSVVPNAYVFAFEDYNLAYDFNDVVGIIRNVKAVPSGPRIGTANLDGLTSYNRLVFNRIDNLDPLVPNVTHDVSSLLIRNTGDQTLHISSMVLNGPYTFVSGGNTTSIAAGSTATVKIQFNGVGTGLVSLINGTLTINSDDAGQPITNITLAGIWQKYSEQDPNGVYGEPSLAMVAQAFGYSDVIAYANQETVKGAYVELGTHGNRTAVGQEVLTGYFTRADVNAPVTVRMLAALHKESSQDPTTMELINTNSVVKWYYQGSSTSPTTLFKHNQDEGQSLLPHLDGSTTSYAVGTFSPNSNAFGFKVDSRFSDDTLNPLDFNETDPNQTPYPNTGHAFRFYPVIDSSGNLVPSTYLMAMDYTGISYSNYDYQDNIYLVSNVVPVSAPSAPASVASSTSNAGISISWAANAEGNVAGYRVYRSDSANGGFSLLTTSLVTGLRYTDVLAPAGQTSFYRVTAVDANGNESAFTATSAALSADVTPPAPPSNVFAAGDPNAIVINWSDNLETDIAGYNVYRSSSASGVFTKLNTDGLLTTPTYTDTTAPAGATSFYQVTAVDNSGNESSFTAVSATRPIVGKNGNASDIKYSPDGTLHFVWYDSASRTMKYASQNVDGNWSSIQTIDRTGDDVGSYLSLAIAPNGKPAVAYYDGTTGDLKYAAYNGSTWDIATVDSKGSVGLYPSLAFNGDGEPAIAYYRKTSGDLRLALLAVSWKITDLDDTDDSGRSVVLTRKPTGYLAAAYEDSTTGVLRYADQITSKKWSLSAIDATTKGVSFISLTPDPSGRMSVSYYDASPADLKYAALKNGKWIVNKIVSSGTVGLHSKLLFSDTGMAEIFYYDKSHDLLDEATGTLGSFSTTQLATAGGKYIAADESPVTGSVCYSFYDDASAGLKLLSLS